MFLMIMQSTGKPGAKFADAYTYGNAINEALKNDGQAIRYSDDELNAFRSGK